MVLIDNIKIIFIFAHLEILENSIYLEFSQHFSHGYLSTGLCGSTTSTENSFIEAEYSVGKNVISKDISLYRLSLMDHRWI